MNKDRYAYGYEVPLNVPIQSVPVITDILNGKHYYSLREVVKLLNEQQATINQLKEENEQLKQQLLYNGDDVCSICKHEYLTPSGDYFIGKCEKGYEECPKEYIKYCEDFELKGDIDE